MSNCVSGRSGANFADGRCRAFVLTGVAGDAVLPGVPDD